jgi:hypothetical protein
LSSKSKCRLGNWQYLKYAGALYRNQHGGVAATGQSISFPRDYFRPNFQNARTPPALRKAGTGADEPEILSFTNVPCTKTHLMVVVDSLNSDVCLSPPWN